MPAAIGMCKVCPAYCPIEVTIEEGRATKIAGDRSSEIYGGYTCPKGRALPDAHYGPERLLQSQRRRPDGSYESMPTGLAVDEITGKLRDIIDRHGPQSVAVIVGNGLAANPQSGMMAASFLSALGTMDTRYYSVGTIDQPGKVIAQALHGRWIPGPQAFRGSDVWMLIGANPVISKMGLEQNPGMAMKEAVRNGMKIIVVDPRATESARHAHLYLQPRAGQDPTLLASLLNVIISEKLYDAAFVKENAQNFQTLARHVAPFTPDHASEVTGVPADQIREAARLFGRAKRGCAVTGTGPHFALHGTLAEYLVLSLNTICGRWVRAGEINTHPHVILPEVIAHAQPLPPYKPWDDSVRSRINNLPKTILGAAAGTLADEILTPGDGQVRALICAGSNPMVSLPGQKRTAEALRSLELLVSLDVSMTNTPRMAHYVIPDKMVLETPGTTQLIESTKYQGLWTHALEFPYAMYSPALVQPPPGSDLMEPWEFFHAVARKLGLQLICYANPAGTGQHWEKPPVEIPLPMDRDLSADEYVDLLATGSRVPMDVIRGYERGHVFDDLDNVVRPRQADCEARLELGDETMMEELDQVFAKNGATAMPSVEFPLMLIPRRANDFYNSTGRDNRMLGGRKPCNPAYLNPSDLERFGVKDGEVVRVRSAYGEVLAVAAAELKLRPGTLSMSHCFGPNPDEEAEPFKHGTCSSALMDANAEYDPLFGQPRMSALPVTVAPLGR